MRLTSVTSMDEERYIISGIRQSADYNPNSVFWLGAVSSSASGQDFSWLDGNDVTYLGWPPYNDTADGFDSDKCLGIKVGKF